MRLLTKFVETNYEKVDRLLDVRESVRVRLKTAEKMIEEEKKVKKYFDEFRDADRSRLFDEQEMQRNGDDIGEEEEDEWYSQKLEGGLFTLQIVDYILGWICMEDDGVRLTLRDSCNSH